MASTVGLALGSSGVRGLTGRVSVCCPVMVGGFLFVCMGNGDAGFVLSLLVCSCNDSEV